MAIGLVFHRRRGIWLAVFLILTLLYLLRSPSEFIATPVNEVTHPIPSSHSTPSASVAKVVFAYDDERKYLSDLDPLTSHQSHATLHNYPIFIQRMPTDPGPWYHTLTLISLILQELGKPLEERVEWLMLVDPDSIVINPEIPVEVFLPPPDFDDIHFVGTKNGRDVDTTTYFIRVNPWSIRLLSRLLGADSVKPADTDYDIYDSAFARALNQSEHRSNVLFQPPSWYNTYESRSGFEGKPGDLLVRFQGSKIKLRSYLKSWSSVVDGENASRWRMPLSETSYPRETTTYWQTLRSARAALTSARAYQNDDTWDLELSAAAKKLWVAIHECADRTTALQKASKKLQQILKELTDDEDFPARKYQPGKSSRSHRDPGIPDADAGVTLDPHQKGAVLREKDEKGSKHAQIHLRPAPKDRAG
jgi:hypothetical protein